MEDLNLIHIQLHESGIANGFLAKENVQACIQLAQAEQTSRLADAIEGVLAVLEAITDKKSDKGLAVFTWQQE